MNFRIFLIAGFVGGICLFLLSSVYYGMIMVDFYSANAGSASGLLKDPPNFLCLLLGELSFGALYAYVFLRWANINTFATGAKAGAVIGLLLGLGFNLINYATANIFNLTASLTDSVWACISGAITGGIVAWVIGRFS